MPDRNEAKDLLGYNGGITTTSQTPPPGSEQAVAQADHLTIESYLLDSVFTHKSARYALEGALYGFATEQAISQLPNPNFIMFSERNCEALDAPDNAEYGSVHQSQVQAYCHCDCPLSAFVTAASNSWGTKGF